MKAIDVINRLIGDSAKRRTRQPSRRFAREVKARNQPYPQRDSIMNSTMIEPPEPSEAIKTILSTVARKDRASRGMRTIMQRQAEFPGPVTAKLTGIALDPIGREVADETLDDYWSNAARKDGLLALARRGSFAEVIIGGGFHAATYAAVRVLSGFPKPLVIERNSRIGGAFAMTDRPTFYLNSRNRAGMGGLAGDQGASLNFLPGAPIQAANVSMAEYQTNTDMAFIVRLALAQYADVITNTNVSMVSSINGGVAVYLGDDYIDTRRIIDARGLGDPVGQTLANGTTILTFPQFMQRMAGMWPLRNLDRVAVVGGGDSGKVTVEALLGIGPQPNMASMALDSVKRIDWYASNLPTDCYDWKESIRGRYAAIGRYLRSPRQGEQRLFIEQRRAVPLSLPNGVLINGRTYDLVVLATGYETKEIDGIESEDFNSYYASGSYDDEDPYGYEEDPIAMKHNNLPVWRAGPHANLPWSLRERQEGVVGQPENRVAMFRTGSKTATLAATLPYVVAYLEIDL